MADYIVNGSSIKAPWPGKSMSIYRKPSYANFFA